MGAAVDDAMATEVWRRRPTMTPLVLLAPWFICAALLPGKPVIAHAASFVGLSGGGEGSDEVVAPLGGAHAAANANTRVHQPSYYVLTGDSLRDAAVSTTRSSHREFSERSSDGPLSGMFVPSPKRLSEVRDMSDSYAVSTFSRRSYYCREPLI